MIPAWQGFSLEIGEDSRLIEIACGLHPFAVIDHRSDISHVSVARFDDNKGTAPAIRQVVEALRGGTPKGGLSDSLLRGLPRAAADAILASASADKIKHARKRGIELAEQTLLFADRNVQRPIQRESLAEAAGISESYVTMLARLQLGLNASDLIRQRRVLAASRLLAHTDLPISDIAWICGFSSSSFSSAPSNS